MSELERVVEFVTDRGMRKHTHDQEDDEQEDGENRNNRRVDDCASLEVDDDEDSQQNEPHSTCDGASGVHTTMFVNFGQNPAQS